MPKHPFTYEINTRSWIKQFGEQATLSNVPDETWSELRHRGIDYVWLMGIWETSQSSIKEYCFHPNLKKAYDKVSADWKEKDIYGSPYAIDDYKLSHHLGTEKDLIEVRKAIHRHGMGLILDFVPNHFNAHSPLIDQFPNVFLQVSAVQAQEDPYTIYSRNGAYFAHGKDPYFPAWTDTVQINYFSSQAHSFMGDKLMKIAKLCDGVRCDMAMLVLPEIFEKTWYSYKSEDSEENPFWNHAIQRVKASHPTFIFMAEAYWNTQWQLQQMGFDYTYDKHLLDLLKSGNPEQIRAHLEAEISYQNKCVRFIENHDEDRSLRELGESSSRAASVIMSTIPGMKLFYDGQWVGRRIRLPVQMGTDFPEQQCICSIYLDLQKRDDTVPCACQKRHYQALMDAVKDDVIRNGDWELLPILSHNTSALAWRWVNGTDQVIVIVNNGMEDQQIVIKTNIANATFEDLLNKNKSPEVILKHQNLQMSLPGYKSVILKVTDQK